MTYRKMAVVHGYQQPDISAYMAGVIFLVLPVYNILVYSKFGLYKKYSQYSSAKSEPNLYYCIILLLI